MGPNGLNKGINTGNDAKSKRKKQGGIEGATRGLPRSRENGGCDKRSLPTAKHETDRGYRRLPGFIYADY